VPVKNGYAAFVRKGKSKRRKLDDYETPESAIRPLTSWYRDLFLGSDPILEPAAGSGRMAKVLREETNSKVYESDIKQGKDFLKRKEKWPGHIITNPPYKDNLPEKFARHALKLAKGKVALLVEGKWLWGSKRANGLFEEYIPETVIVLSSRIYFHEGSGKPIKSQFFSHCWVVWPSEENRLTNEETQLWIVDQNKDSYER